MKSSKLKVIMAGIFAGSLMVSGGLWAEDKAAPVEGATEAAEATVATEAAAESTENEAEVRSGEAVYQSVCMACHVAEGMPTVAPPIFAVKNHVLGAYPEREAFIKQVTEWVKAPDEKNALMPGAIRKFGLMPATEVPDEELQAVAEFLYDSDMSLPDWYKEHYAAEHGEMPKEAVKAEVAEDAAKTE